MVKLSRREIDRLEQQYPGFKDTLEYYENLSVPPCPRCASWDTATVSYGLVGRSINMAAATRKMKLVPNVEDRRAPFFCNACQKSFNVGAKS